MDDSKARLNLMAVQIEPLSAEDRARLADPFDDPELSDHIVDSLERAVQDIRVLRGSNAVERSKKLNQTERRRVTNEYKRLHRAIEAFVDAAGALSIEGRERFRDARFPPFPLVRSMQSVDDGIRRDPVEIGRELLWQIEYAKRAVATEKPPPVNQPAPLPTILTHNLADIFSTHSTFTVGRGGKSPSRFEQLLRAAFDLAEIGDANVRHYADIGARTVAQKTDREIAGNEGDR